MLRQDPVPAPPRMAARPRDRRGYLVPWFVAIIDGEPDFRVIAPGRIALAVRQRRCWLCGEVLGRHLAFNIGPMCAINRVSSEPPSHRDCAIYAAQACPFLTQPGRPRRPQGMPEEGVSAAGMGLPRNPGVALVWMTTSYRVDPIRRADFAPGAPIQEGVLFQVGDPDETLWFYEGRPATREQVLDSILSGLPALRTTAEAEGAAAVQALEVATARAFLLLPPETIRTPGETNGGSDETPASPRAASVGDRETPRCPARG